MRVLCPGHAGSQGLRLVRTLATALALSMLDCHAHAMLSTRLGETLMLHASNASDSDSVRLSDAWSVAMPPRAVRSPCALPAS